MRKNFLLFMSLVGAIVFAGCEKNETPPTGQLMIVNASPNSANIDAAANGTVIVQNLAYPNNSGYKTVSTGNNNITVNQTGSATPFINGTLNIEANSHYSLYIVDSAHERKATATRDDLTPPASGKSKVRVLHFSPNGPNIDILANGSTTAGFSNRGFNDVASNASFQNFTEVNAGVLVLQVRLAGTSTVLATFPSLTLQAGKIYTVLVRGFAGGTGTQALNGEIIAHN